MPPIIVGAQIIHMMALANMQMHQIAHMYLVNEILKQEPRSARLTGAAGGDDGGVFWGHLGTFVGDLGTFLGIMG